MVLKILLGIRFHSMILFYYIYTLVYEYITTLVTTVLYCHPYTYVVHSAHTGIQHIFQVGTIVSISLQHDKQKFHSVNKKRKNVRSSFIM